MSDNQFKAILVYCSFNRLFLVSGCTAGATQAMITCPVELIKISQQVKTASKASWRKHFQRKEHGVIAVVRSIYAQKKIMGFYKGFIPTLCRYVYNF